VGNLAIVKRLKEVMDPDLKAPIVDDQPYGGSALLSAVNSGNSHVVTFLVDSGAPINATYWLGSALMIASQHGHQGMFNLSISLHTFPPNNNSNTG
jgi:ankyrin repeat protein